MRFTFAVVFAALMFASPAVAHERLEFRGQAIVPTGTTFAGTTVGGLSSSRTTAARRLLQPLRRPEPVQPRASTRRGSTSATAA